MAFWLAGEINLDVVRVQLQKILSPYHVLLTDDIDALPDSAWQETEILLRYWQQPSVQQLWTCLELIQSFDRAFEIEEYLAGQLNQQYEHVTVAECYRLMSPQLKGTVTSGYYSILFDEHHRVMLVNNLYADQQDAEKEQVEKLDFVPLAYLDSKPDDQYFNYYNQTSAVDEIVYLGTTLDDQFYPIIQANYHPLSWSDVVEFLK